MFEMGTGDPSQYGHRQTWYGAWRVGLPTACRGVCSSRMVYPGPGRNADCNLAPQTLLSLELIDTKLIEPYKALSKSIREHSYCAELILWTSRTGD